MIALKRTPTSRPLKAHVSGNCNPIPDCTQTPVSCFFIVDKLTREVFYCPMQVANTVLFKVQPTEKALKLLKARLSKSSGPIWKLIKINVFYNLLYVPAINPNLHDYNANHNIPDITIISKTEIWAIYKAESTDAFLFKWDSKTDKDGKWAAGTTLVEMLLG